MLLSTNWLKETYFIDLPPKLLTERLTMAGLEVDGISKAAPEFSGVVIGEVLTLSPHPDADKLRVATVNTGHGEALQIVCGAPNVAAGVKVPVATIGAILPDDFKIKKSKLRGVESFGMLCSARELGLSEDHAGLLILPENAPVGVDIRNYLGLDDNIIDIDLTPNRADCFSMRGLAREIAVLCAPELGSTFSLTLQKNQPVVPTSGKKIKIDNQNSTDCPLYLARCIENVDPNRPTPSAIVEKLRRAGVRTHDPLVDITNFVMLELGTPLHAFDAAQISGGIVIRQAKKDETLTLLNNDKVTLNDKILIIADQEKPLAIAGVMGGAASACTSETKNIVLEAAWFNPIRIAGKARQFGLSSDSAQRFERGVDFTLQQTAIELATRLILEICGGEAGEICSFSAPQYLPSRETIILERAAIGKRIGREYSNERITDIFTQLGCQVSFANDQWTVTPPAWRFDLTIAEDLIEEIARVDGYHNITANLPVVSYQQAAEDKQFLRFYSDLLTTVGFQEAVTYSFIDRNSQQIFSHDAPVITLQNPISANLAEMRLSLLPGLVNALIYNRNRQQQDIRLFEIGRVFLPQEGKIAAECEQPLRISGVMAGLAEPEQWGSTARKIDFFDVKAVVELLLSFVKNIEYRPSQKSWLHPGKSADIFVAGEYFGSLGALHPQTLADLGTKGGDIYVFEINEFLSLPQQHVPQYQTISKFPIVRRDLALVVDKTISAADILQTVRKEVGKDLLKTFCFDLYQGENLGEKQSLAIAILLQDREKTLQDEYVESIISRLIKQLNELFAAELR